MFYLKFWFSNFVKIIQKNLKKFFEKGQINRQFAKVSKMKSTFNDNMKRDFYLVSQSVRQKEKLNSFKFK